LPHGDAPLQQESTGRLDHCAALVLADFLKRGGVVARAAATVSAIENDAVKPYACAFSRTSRQREPTLRSGSSPARRQQLRSSSAFWEMPRMRVMNREARMLRRGRWQPR
jgi:hypothetical protein